MSTESAPTTGLDAPLAWVGRQALGGLAYLGGIGLLAGSAARSLLRPLDAKPALGPAAMWQLARLLGMGVPLVGLVHVGLGSFLAMQSYFGGTFVEAAGAVVGVGLVRNLASMMAGLTLAALLATRITPDLRARTRLTADSGPPPEAGRLTAVRLVAAMVAGPILGLWGAVVGTVVGWLVSISLLGISTATFAQMFLDMLWARDVVGLFVKGMLFGCAGALFACSEGFRDDRGSDPEATARAVFRAVCLSALAILLLNATWFTFVYRSGPAFGPTLMTPPTP